VSVTLPYQLFRVRNPLIQLGGQADRPRPVITVTLIGPEGSRVQDALLDTGADDTVFPETLAGALGIDLTNAPTIHGAGVGLIPYVVRLAEVTLCIADNQERREWRAWICFTSAPLRQPLLGYAGYLQFFDATFLGQRQVVERTVNSSYPGT
jgi:predicted aspartyl protease